MATRILASNKSSSFTLTSCPCSCKGTILNRSNMLHVPKIRIDATHLRLPKLSTSYLTEDIQRTRNVHEIATKVENNISTSSEAAMVNAKLYAMMEAVADRIEMHENIGKQRDNWNNLLLTSINTMTLTAATMCGLASVVPQSSPFKISSTLLYLAAGAMSAIMNTIQPSQLAEEQRNASRLFKHLHRQIQTTLSTGDPTIDDVNEALENVLALDRAFPLPLLGVMLEKFPETVKPAVWWPQQKKQKHSEKNSGDRNGWNNKVDKEMRAIVKVLKRKDEADYLRLAELALKVNKIMAISGPLFTFVAAMGSAFVGCHPWAATVGVVGGALASIVNVFEHGGQVGMVFEMYRNNAGFFKLMEETIESNINERDVRARENGEMLEMKVALQLGRSLSDLRNLVSSSRNEDEATQEFASKLF
ncbi:probable F-box protein At4g22030 [Mercurialis annua]|uniref:probable F-box protein At4g22030 n=1 Tax=Mercurialis annua TaxID=3986 RepID=UPI002160B836|nr:probable F-box protein At4g22030 [Mercurialis annua]